MGRQVRQYGSGGKESTGQQSLSAEDLEKLHLNADTDVRPESLHHTLGASSSQASPGDHTHDGGTSSPILIGLTISGSRGGNTSLPSIIACLVRLGAVDNSSA